MLQVVRIWFAKRGGDSNPSAGFQRSHRHESDASRGALASLSR